MANARPIALLNATATATATGRRGPRVALKKSHWETFQLGGEEFQPVTLAEVSERAESADSLRRDSLAEPREVPTLADLGVTLAERGARAVRGLKSRTGKTFSAAAH